MEHSIFEYQPLWDNWKIDKLLSENNYESNFKIFKETQDKKEYCLAKYLRFPNNNEQTLLLEISNNEELENKLEELLDIYINKIETLKNLNKYANIISIFEYSVFKRKNEIAWDIIIRTENCISLKEYLSHNSITQADILKLGKDILKAIEVCRVSGIVHKEINEENIFITNKGNFKLGNFSIFEKKIDLDFLLNCSSHVFYMAPEITKGKPHSISSDIYSLGIVMYKLLNNGRFPFLPQYPSDVTVEDVDKAIHSKFIDAEPCYPKNCNEELGKIIIKACSQDEKERYQLPAEMYRDLEKIKGEDEIVYTPSIESETTYNLSEKIMDSLTKKEKNTISSNDISKDVSDDEIIITTTEIVISNNLEDSEKIKEINKIDEIDEVEENESINSVKDENKIANINNENKTANNYILQVNEQIEKLSSKKKILLLLSMFTVILFAMIIPSSIMIKSAVNDEINWQNNNRIKINPGSDIYSSTDNSQSSLNNETQAEPELVDNTSNEKSVDSNNSQDSQITDSTEINSKPKTSNADSSINMADNQNNQANSETQYQEYQAAPEISQVPTPSSSPEIKYPTKVKNIKVSKIIENQIFVLCDPAKSDVPIQKYYMQVTGYNQNGECIGTSIVYGRIASDGKVAFVFDEYKSEYEFVIEIWCWDEKKRLSDKESYTIKPNGL